MTGFYNRVTATSEVTCMKTKSESEITPSCVLAAETDRFSIRMSQLVVLFASFVATMVRFLLPTAWLFFLVNVVKFNEYASVVVSAGYDRSLRAWDCRSRSTEPIRIIDSFLDIVMSVYLTKTEIIGGSVDGTVQTFDIRIGKEISNDLGQPVNCISMSNDGNCILASCLDSTLCLLDRSTDELLQEYKGHACKSYKMDCCLTNTDASVLNVTGGSEDGSIFFWDLVDASVVSKF
ncbi:hypothetical protein CRYUN_Cryun15aG0079300 [Craigia yunnanensis]